MPRFLLSVISPRGGAVTYASDSRVPDKMNADGADTRLDACPPTSDIKAKRGER